jgi:hypothetical protein
MRFVIAALAENAKSRGVFSKPGDSPRVAAGFERTFSLFQLFFFFCFLAESVIRLLIV